MEKSSSSFVPPDGGWGWVVCFASFLVNGTIFGIMNSSGILFVKLKETFQGAAFSTSWVESISIGMTFLLSPIASVLTDKFGIKRTALLGGFLATVGMLTSSFVQQLPLLCLTYGVILGTGASLCYTPSLVILGHYFHRHLGLVNGIVTAGSSVFTMVMPFLLSYLLHTVQFAGTMQILSVMMAVLMVCALTFQPLVSHNPTKHSTSKVTDVEKSCCSQIWHSIIHVTIWKNKKYLCWALSIPTALFGYFVPYLHLVQHVKDILPDANGSILVMCIGLTSGLGRIIVGKVADHPRINRICLQQISFLCIGVLTMLLVIAKDFIILVVMCLFFGLCDGCFISLLGPIAFDLVGHKAASQAIGSLLGFVSVPLTIGPPVAGLLYDKLGNYTIAFIAAGIPPILGAILMCIIHRMPQPRRRDNLETLNHICTQGVPCLDEKGKQAYGIATWEEKSEILPALVPETISKSAEL
ncbi:monocarboxylate transporter 10-like [Centruroides sculpturatus]|uniref:monocarboxylate transporter 10-like n=1 Tax=Centruroides sculpturatus TaxID=218467 RepID=UPI000C6E86B0|nr:monocarboxylate transporter 10-like [Centruroides sculpturatus]